MFSSGDIDTGEIGHTSGLKRQHSIDSLRCALRIESDGRFFGGPDLYRSHQEISRRKLRSAAISFSLRRINGQYGPDKKKPGSKPGEVKVRQKSKPSRGNGRYGSAGRKKAVPR
jgi:hypothetical protein